MRVGIHCEKGLLKSGIFVCFDANHFFSLLTTGGSTDNTWGFVLIQFAMSFALSGILLPLCSTCSFTARRHIAL